MSGVSKKGLFDAIDDSAFFEIVRWHFDFDFVAFSDSDVVDTQLSAEICKNLMAVRKLNSELRFGQNFDDFAFGFNNVFFGHKLPYFYFSL